MEWASNRPWWPPAPGWYAVAVIVVTIALHVASRLYRRRHARRYRVEALAALHALPLTDCDSNYAAEVMRPSGMSTKSGSVR